MCKEQPGGRGEEEECAKPEKDQVRVWGQPNTGAALNRVRAFCRSGWTVGDLQMTPGSNQTGHHQEFGEAENIPSESDARLPTWAS